MVHYFAYGSNMDQRAIRALCPSSRCLGAARLDGYRLAFTRRSQRTGTGVADVVPTPGETVWGVLYALELAEFVPLDEKEGRGHAYERFDATVTLPDDGSAHEAIAYEVIAKRADEVVPSRAYADGLLAAAREHGFPADYLALLESVAARVPASPTVELA